MVTQNVLSQEHRVTDYSLAVRNISSVLKHILFHFVKPPNDTLYVIIIHAILETLFEEHFYFIAIENHKATYLSNLFMQEEEFPLSQIEFPSIT